MRKLGVSLLCLFTAYLSAMEDGAEVVTRVQSSSIQLHMSHTRVRAVIEVALMQVQLIRAEVFNQGPFDHVCWLLNGLVLERLLQLQQINQQEENEDFDALLSELQTWTEHVRTLFQHSRQRGAQTVMIPELRVHDVAVLSSLEIDTGPLVLSPQADAAQKAIGDFLLYCQREAEQYAQKLACESADSLCVIL